MDSGVSVVTVTLNNCDGLRETLRSLSSLRFRPLEVLVIDGGSSDGTSTMIREFSASLSLKFTSECDAGIYDAMNKGRERATGKLIHYLNAGDTVWGEPYQFVAQPTLLPVRINDERGKFLFNDFPKYSGFGYCHQGIIFPKGHSPYNTELRIASDLDLIIDTFPDGLQRLPLVRGGGISFRLGGLSTTRSHLRNQEVRRIFFRRLPFWRAIGLATIISLKNLVPRGVRQQLLVR